MFSVAFDIVGLDILSSSLVEEVFQVSIFFRNGARQHPDGVS